MNEKILFWLDIGLTHFAIAKFLQEKHKGDMYAIIDCNNHLKKFFLNQNLVKFTKIWLFRDNISTMNNPDKDYLRNFENKYKINLWNLVYSERYFYKYNKFYNFKKNEILSLLESECKFFEKILDEVKPDFLIIRQTDYHQNHLLHEICKKKNIKILTISIARLGHNCIISTDGDKLDVSNPTIISKKSRSWEDLRDHVKRYSDLVKEFNKGDRNSLAQQLKAALRFLVFVCNDEYRSYFANYGRTRLKIIYFEMIGLIKRWYRQDYLKKISLKEIDDKIPFVYYPLHVEPERVLSIAAPFFTNQTEVITHIAKSLPVDFLLYVKEHPDMRMEGWRKISQYKAISKLPNVRLLNTSVLNDEILMNCSLVITIAGTAGLEAAFYNKPSIVFSDVIYSKLSSVHKVTNIEELPQIIQLALRQKVNLDDLNDYVDLIEKNSFVFDMADMQTSWYNHFFYGGFLKEVNISEQKMRRFLEEKRPIFEKLVSEYIKKLSNIN